MVYRDNTEVNCSIDKRIEAREKSFASIYAALFTLLAKNALSNITISALIKESGVARSTFYRHFHSVHDVYDRWKSYLLDEFDREGIEIDFLGGKYLLHVFQFYKRFAPMIAVIHRAGLSSDILAGIIEYHVDKLGDMPRDSIERYRLYYYAGAIFCTVMEWIVSGTKESPEKMVEQFLIIESSSVNGDR